MVESIINKILENFTAANENANTLDSNISKSEIKVITTLTTESASGTTEQLTEKN